MTNKPRNFETRTGRFVRDASGALLAATAIYGFGMMAAMAVESSDSHVSCNRDFSLECVSTDTDTQTQTPDSLLGPAFYGVIIGTALGTGSYFVARPLDRQLGIHREVKRFSLELQMLDSVPPRLDHGPDSV